MGKIPSGWRTAISQHAKPPKRAGKRLSREAHKAGKCRGYHVPDYQTSDDLYGAVLRSLASDVLGLIP